MQVRSGTVRGNVLRTIDFLITRAYRELDELQGARGPGEVICVNLEVEVLLPPVDFSTDSRWRIQDSLHLETILTVQKQGIVALGPAGPAL